jgi:hypothetical protein
MGRHPVDALASELEPFRDRRLALCARLRLADEPSRLGIPITRANQVAFEQKASGRQPESVERVMVGPVKGGGMRCTGRIGVCVLVLAALFGCRSHGHASTGFSFSVDPTIVPSEPTLAAAVDSNGVKFEYAPNQLVVHPKDRSSLDAFLARYHGTVLVDGSQPKTLGFGSASMPATDFYLVEVDPKTSALDDFEVNGNRANAAGLVRFSSDTSARLAALVARERPGIDVGVNLAMHGNDFQITTSVPENIDFATVPYMKGVIQAWDYLEYKGIPFGPNPWHPPTIAIVDGGFALDGSGTPIGNNPDFDIARITELDETVDGASSHRHNAGGTNPASCTDGFACPYHGNGVFSIAAAIPFNHFGVAGTSGLVAQIMLIKANATLMFEVASGVSDSALIIPPADVINLSMGSGPCGVFCGYIAANTFTDFQANINFARGYASATVVAAAGNSDEDNDSQYYNVPCTLDGVLCVGATQWSGQVGSAESYSGRGSRVQIWAPDGLYVTPMPINATTLATTITFDYGTSASTPFVSGIVALMKALSPSLYSTQVISILQATATPSSDPVVKPGIVNALAALQSISPNLPPTISITSPIANQSFFAGTSVELIASIADPELAQYDTTGMSVTWTDNVQGSLGTTNLCSATLTSLGTHHITATVTDGWGAKASQTIDVVVSTGPPPAASIDWPANNITYAVSQQVELRGSGHAASPPYLVPPAQLAWVSDRDGALGTGADLFVTLSIGTHHITLTATDSFGQTGTATITLNIVAGADVPTAQILSPLDHTTVPVNHPFTLVGKGTDPIDGALPDAGLVWSHPAGPLGIGRNVTVTFTGSCGPAVDTITLTVRNRAGKTATTTVVVFVGGVC